MTLLKVAADGNMLQDIPDKAASEIYDTLLRTPHVKIERIVSHGQFSPPDFWYDQVEDEWVLLLAGHARLQFASDMRLQEMQAGEHLFIPAHTKHRVDWTDPHTATVWLAVFIPA